MTQKILMALALLIIPCFALYSSWRLKQVPARKENEVSLEQTRIQVRLLTALIIFLLGVLLLRLFRLV
jgi:hypothetical protein